MPNPTAQRRWCCEVEANGRLRRRFASNKKAKAFEEGHKCQTPQRNAVKLWGRYETNTSASKMSISIKTKEKMSYVTSLYHIVFATHHREPVLTEQYSPYLYAMMASLIKKKNSEALIVNGVENHIHILLSLNPKVALADMMRDLKSQSSIWIKNSGYFPIFTGWAREYGAFSLSASHRQAVYEYICNQKPHHKDKNLDEEFRRLVMKNGLTFYEWPE